jgi:hypothetical protein
MRRSRGLGDVYKRQEQALSAWIYLEKIYRLDPLFSIQKTPTGNIQAEKQRIKEEDASFLAILPKGSYVSWFLPTRKLVSDVGYWRIAASPWIRFLLK